ncbi:MAG: hypothetical protein K2I64_01690 [Muribaculaceae bacterium]|nr:hypothetical protein [Muribaculaceae bacterium]
MKPHYISLALAILPIAASAAGKESADTLISVEKPSTLVITENAQGISVSILPHDGETPSTLDIAEYRSGQAISTEQQNSSYFTLNAGDGGAVFKTSSHWNVVSNGLIIGLVNPMGQPENFGLQWAKSFEIGWLNTLAVRYSHRGAALSLGIGLDWRNYKTTTTGHRYMPDSATGIATAPYPEGATHGSSRIKIFSLGFPLLYTQKFGKSGMAVTAGAILNLNTHGSLLTKYTDSKGHEWEEYSTAISRRRVSCDIFGALTFYKGCGLYVRYSPQSVLKGPGVPDFHPLSVGLTLFL